MPLIDRVEFRREKESIPRFSKFMQGYYDKSAIIKESYDSVIQAGELSQNMIELGIHLVNHPAQRLLLAVVDLDDVAPGVAVDHEPVRPRVHRDLPSSS